MLHSLQGLSTTRDITITPKQKSMISEDNPLEATHHHGHHQHRDNKVHGPPRGATSLAVALGLDHHCQPHKKQVLATFPALS